MKLAKISPDLKFLQIEEQPDGRIKIIAHALKKDGSTKKVGELVPGPTANQDLVTWAKPHLTRIGMKLMAP